MNSCPELPIIRPLLLLLVHFSRPLDRSLDPCRVSSKLSQLSQLPDSQLQSLTEGETGLEKNKRTNEELVSSLFCGFSLAPTFFCKRQSTSRLFLSFSFFSPPPTHVPPRFFHLPKKMHFWSTLKKRTFASVTLRDSAFVSFFLPLNLSRARFSQSSLLG